MVPEGSSIGPIRPELQPDYQFLQPIEIRRSNDRKIGTLSQNLIAPKNFLFFMANITWSPDGICIVFGAAFPINLLTRRIFANVPRAMTASLPRRDP